MTGDQRVARRRLLARYIGDAGDTRPHGLGSAGDWHVEVTEEPAFPGQTVEVRRRIQRVAVGAHGAGAEGFEHDENHVGLAFGLDAMRLHWLVAKEVQRVRIALADAQIIGHHVVVLARGRLIESAGFELEGVEEKQRRVDPERTHLTVATVERITPAQRHRVLQVQRAGTAEQAEEHQHADRCRAADCRQHADSLCVRPIQGGALQSQQRP